MTPLDQKKVIMDHIKRGDVEYFKRVELDLLLNYREHGWIDNILGLAIKENQLECCKEILKRCPSQIFYESEYGGTALHHAHEAPNDRRSGIVSMLSFLVDFGSKAEDDIETGTTGGGGENTRFKKWVKLNNDELGYTAMMTCIVCYRYIDVVRWWVKVDEDMQLGLLGIPSHSKDTALHYAVKQQDLELVTLLAAREPDFVYGLNDKGDTPLSLAMRTAQSSGSNSDKTAEKIRKLLLEKQPNQSKVRIGTEGWTVLHHATNNGDLRDIMEIIRFCPECTELTDNNGRNFLHLAVKLEKIDIVKNVLEIKEISLSVLNGKDNYGYTPLHIAAETGNEGLILCILYDPRVDKMTSNAKGQKVLDAITVDYDYTKAGVYGVRDRMNEKELKDQSDFDLVVGALIATVSFTAGITVPGGFIADGPNKGTAMLAKSTSFDAFVISNCFALAFSLYAVFSHFCTRRLLRRKDIIYQLNVAQRVKLFLWKAINEGLPTREILHIRNVTSSASCPRCHIHKETTSHALFHCPELRKIWFASQLSLRISYWNPGHDRDSARDPEEGEARAIARSMRMIEQLQIRSVTFLTDCKHLAETLEQQNTDLTWGSTSVAHDILSFSSSLEYCTFLYITRETNYVAHHLAMRGRIAPPFESAHCATAKALIELSLFCNPDGSSSGS